MEYCLGSASDIVEGEAWCRCWFVVQMLFGFFMVTSLSVGKLSTGCVMIIETPQAM